MCSGLPDRAWIFYSNFADPNFFIPVCWWKNILFYKIQKDRPKNFGLKTMLGDKKNCFHVGIFVYGKWPGLLGTSQVLGCNGTSFFRRFPSILLWPPPPARLKLSSDPVLRYQGKSTLAAFQKEGQWKIFKKKKRMRTIANSGKQPFTQGPYGEGRSPRLAPKKVKCSE